MLKVVATPFVDETNTDASQDVMTTSMSSTLVFLLGFSFSSVTVNFVSDIVIEEFQGTLHQVRVMGVSPVAIFGGFLLTDLGRWMVTQILILVLILR